MSFATAMRVAFVLSFCGVLLMMSSACASSTPSTRAPEPAALGAERIEVSTDRVRQPDGVFLDVRAATPIPVDVATADGVVAIVSPLTQDEARRLVRAYFEAFAQGTASAFLPLLARGALRQGAPNVADLAVSLERRVHAVDYSHLSARSAAAYEELRLSPYDAASPSLRTAAAMQPGDVFVDVPVRAESVAGVRLFGPRVGLVVRREGRAGSWKIAAVEEPDAPWDS